MTQHLYRMYDANENLLYIGVSVNALARFAQHKLDKPWIDDVAKVTIESHKCSRSEIEAMEREAIVLERPRHLRGSVARNVLDHGTGALNIDACRVPADADYEAKCASVVGSSRNGSVYGFEWSGVWSGAHPAGRWPTNVVLSADQAAELADAGRYFPTFRYEFKAPSDERPRVGVVAHPTVKPLDLMRWLVRLVTPPSGTVLDPFAGSGTTAEACFIEGFRCVTIERCADYLPLIRARFDKPIQQALLG